MSVFQTIGFYKTVTIRILYCNMFKYWWRSNIPIIYIYSHILYISYLLYISIYLHSLTYTSISPNSFTGKYIPNILFELEIIKLNCGWCKLIFFCGFFFLGNLTKNVWNWKYEQTWLIHMVNSKNHLFESSRPYKILQWIPTIFFICDG